MATNGSRDAAKGAATRTGAASCRRVAITPGTLGRWPALAVATAVLAVGAGAAGVPSAALFAALLTGLVWALASGGAMVLPRRAVVPAQAVIGAALGSYLELEPLTALGGRWLPVGVVVAGTLVVSLLAGVLVASVTGLDRPTALLGLVAGGAAGIVVMSDELGADARLVAVMQYVRVFVVVLLAPLLMAFAFGDPGAGSGTEPGRARRATSPTRSWPLRPGCSWRAASGCPPQACSARSPSARR